MQSAEMRGSSRFLLPIFLLPAILLPSLLPSLANPASSSNSWTINRGEAETVILTTYRSFFQMVYDSLFGGAYDLVTLFEYTSSKTLSVTTREVESTGNTLTFRVEPSKAFTNIVSGSGPKIELPFAVYYLNGRLIEKRNKAQQYVKSQEITLLIFSASTQNIKRMKNHLYPQTPTPNAILKALGDNPASSDAVGNGRKPGLVNTGVNLCGYRGLRDRAAFQTLNPLASAGVSTPFKSSNVFVKLDASRNVSQIVYCTPGAGDSICRAHSFLNDWAPFTIYFDSHFLCETDKLAEQARFFLNDRIARETKSYENIDSK